MNLHFEVIKRDDLIDPWMFLRIISKKDRTKSKKLTKSEPLK